MAIVRHLERQQLSVEARHSETDCTYSIVCDPEGTNYLQIDTYGSRDRKMSGKKSQSIRFTLEAIRELRQILDAHF